jgi:acetyl esterase/lipase
MLLRGMVILLLLVAALIGDAPAQQNQSLKTEDPPWLKELLPKRVVYTIPGMERVQVRKEIIYKRVADAQLKMDVYAPPGLTADSPRPAIVFIHGGAIPPNLRTQPKDWGVFISYGQLLAASGFIAITFNHRFYGWERLNDAQSDVDDLMTYIRHNASSLGIDRDRITLWAFSGGGPFLSSAIRDAPPYVRCIVSYYALMDPRTLRQEIPVSVSDQTLQTLSPLYYLNKKSIAPIFIARAGLDDTGFNVAIDQFVQEALSRNMTIDFSNHAEGHHAFDILDNNERSREIIKRTIEFIKSHN